jgi:hypothetical protein
MFLLAGRKSLWEDPRNIVSLSAIPSEGSGNRVDWSTGKQALAFFLAFQVNDPKSRLIDNSLIEAVILERRNFG